MAGGVRQTNASSALSDDQIATGSAHPVEASPTGQRLTRLDLARVGIGGDALRGGVGPAGDVGHRLAARAQTGARERNERRRLGHHLGARASERTIRRRWWSTKPWVPASSSPRHSSLAQRLRAPQSGIASLDGQLKSLVAGVAPRTNGTGLNRGRVQPAEESGWRATTAPRRARGPTVARPALIIPGRDTSI